uniref:Dynein-1, subspecies f n=1 Tax=Chromera velia CCMP2878 TaxID=1169474 RepID=A0A0G4GMS7_9ALVE|eukprot:Cvel_4924.t1-p1 / transcript=Cvel_4924.t1 / gene=Cvel_4924 / organism=Chromera_velia_CCMP2878 / gene_product=Dynein beta chain, flagellar outer arm, putative / transcript_product=Dynein beta chain, flagellar outer arm, putative / location=Cvel_scaffold222:38197-69326(+) / protein_length=4541 / sequence_SO=supercontig / SO=protein_coding / is_pseudo=false
MADEEKKKEVDPRASFILSRVSSLFGFKKGNFEKFRTTTLQDENTARAVGNFLDDSDTNFVFFYAGSGESASAPSRDLPTPDKLKKKAVLVTKTRPETTIEKDNMTDQMFFMEWTRNVTDILDVLCHSVYLSTLSNPLNQRGWSDLISTDLMDKFHVFLANLHVTVGLMKGRTQLPLPPSENPEKSSSKERLHVLESAVITWTKQIRHVLKKDPEAALKAGLDPDPTVELEFWKHKATNLNSIHEQLQTSGVTAVLKFLEVNKSTYVHPFAKLQAEVAEAREEANDNVKFLTPLLPFVQRLTEDTAEFAELPELFEPIFNMLLLVWRHSQYYNTPARLVVIVREFCNTIIDQARRFITGSQVFEAIINEEAHEAVDKLEKVLSVCTAFKDMYFKYKEYADAKGKGWKIQTAALFCRLDAFRDRARDILEFVKTVVQFTKLEKIEIGGTRGKTLTNSIATISSDFKETVTKFQEVDYDILDVAEKRLDERYFQFRCSTKELERRLASVLTAAFDDSNTVQGRLKLFESFEGLLERPIIQDELEKKHIVLLGQYKEDLRQCQRIYNQNRGLVDQDADLSPVFANLPPVAGALYWIRSLIQRVDEPMQRLDSFSKGVLEKPEELAEVRKVYRAIMTLFRGYEAEKLSAWRAEDVDSTKEKLKQRLLRRQEDTGLLKVNFDPALKRLLREVKYFKLLGVQVPEAAEEIYSKVDIYRKQTAALDLIMNKYNGVLTELLPVEEPLLDSRIVLMDQQLSPGLAELKWRSMNIDEFLASTHSVVTDVAQVVDTLKDNLRKLSDQLAKWCEEPMLERKPKPMPVEDFEMIHRASVQQRQHQMLEDGKELHKLVRDSADTLKVSKASPPWKSYQDFVSNIAVEGLVTSVTVSLSYLLNVFETAVQGQNQSEAQGKANAKGDTQPLFDVNIVLEEKDVVFEPPFEHREDNRGLRDTVSGWVQDFFSVGTVMGRLDSGTGDYLQELKDHFGLQSLCAQLSGLLDLTEAKMEEYRLSFMQYSFLWLEDLDEAFELFLVENPKELVDNFQPNEENNMSFEQIMKTVNVDVGQQIPSLSDFDDKISNFFNMQKEIADKKTPVDIHWLKVNAQKLKTQLGALAKKWAEKFISFLHDFCAARIDALDNFIKNLAQGFASKDPTQDTENKKLLYEVMTHIRDVRIAGDAVKAMIDPLRNQVGLLKKHNTQVAEEKIAALDSAQQRWDEVTHKAFEVKETILPLQNMEMLNIRKTLDQFQTDVEEFRQKFEHDAPFNHEYEFEAAYAKLDEFYRETMRMHEQASEYKNLETLFDMTESKYRPITQTLADLQLLKDIWDAITLVKYTFNDWKATLWDKINTDDLLSRVKDMAQQVKNLPKELKGWKLFQWLTDEVKNMSIVLPLINDLHSDSMRDRHWKQLMAVTGKTFTKGPEFCLEDLLNLKLHQHADEVGEIVDQAAKEARNEKKLGEIRKAWTSLTLGFDQAREDLYLLQPLDDIVEVLDQHSMDLMGLVGQGKFVEFIKGSVDEWQGKLRTVDSVLTVWMKVQRNWQRLEPIFMLSEDIRSQLPEDSKRFETLDAQFKELMMDASQSPLAVDACCVEGREELLKGIFGMIELCEKSLNDYLEQKKKAFPRFYFVSNQALLDILSNGNNPKKVAEYLGDCFDGIQTLDFDFEKSKEGRSGKGLFSKEMEVVPFYEEYVADGAVEHYLSRLEAHMRSTLRQQLEIAKGTADNWEVDNPREEWLRDYCAQVALVASQIVWTDEVSRAFEELEQGAENAMKDYKRVCDDRIEKLILQVQKPLDKNLRVKIITLITIDVHARDVVEGFVQKKLADSSAFQWQSQLRFYWSKEKRTCIIRICDWITEYAYEYVGNCGRLVITPLTDRCYITLTQALNLVLGGAPAGPAGTGKTETTKDLSRAIGLPVVVFNCSDQMTYLTTAQIFMGLAQTGAWGCFDEFNRISIEVLSVVSTQVKSILDAIAGGKEQFLFMDEEISLVPTCGFFITMNPGYAGRTELPENLKALFRSCAMIVPDIMFICENMLMAEGFLKARDLADKFVTLYGLSKELLSKAMHYDWGLRAVKAVLRQAGGLKRADPDIDEQIILMRALRDFNIPKITTDDKPIFLRLIEDLFPGIEAPTKTNQDLAKVVKDQAKEDKLQQEDAFILKVVQLKEILEVRHCCFVLGPPGCGKTVVWKTLCKVNKKLGEDAVFEALNPKGISSSELYGYVTKTKEWKDGVIAVTMRDMCKEQNGYKPSHKHKWIILDGDIDAEWIESMNTVMDDNKVLTLVSNERIPFTATMRMLLEIENMNNASPATVSRGGVLFINETDIGWKPYVESWRETLPDQLAQSQFYIFFAHYFEQSIEYLRKSLQFSAPMWDISFVVTICCLIDAQLHNNTKENMEALKNATPDEAKVIYEAYFVFAMMWSIGCCVSDDKINNYRGAFTGWLRSTVKTFKFPEGGLVHDYRWCKDSWVPWADLVAPYEPLQEQMFANIIVSTLETTRMNWILDLHRQRSKPALFVGSAGTGKTTIIKDYFRGLPEEVMSANLNLNSYTDSLTFQRILESYIEKRTGKTFGPPGNKKLIYFVDDINMPFVDKYGTQAALALLRQIMDYGIVFDRDHLEEKKDIVDILFFACLNPKAGSFTINNQLQRHFTVFSTFTPNNESIANIFTKILGKHLAPFDKQVVALQDRIIQATVEVFTSILNNPTFLPSAKKFHYNFNLRDMSAVFQGLLNSNAAHYKAQNAGTTKFLRLWIHENSRVFRDRLVADFDMQQFDDIVDKVAKKVFPEEKPEQLFEEGNIYTSFVSAHGGNDKMYLPIKDMPDLRRVLQEKLTEYNETFAEMNLVLFDEAIQHVTRICRIIDQPAGNALLVGVGGSGKQSLSRLAIFILGFDVITILVNQSYDSSALKLDLQEMYTKSAVKPGTPHAFLMTDQQIVDEKFLVFLNDFLSSGLIPDLFTREEYDGLIGGVRNVAKASGVPDSRDAMFNFLIDRVRRNLHLVLCHSPVGNALRVRARKFPALISCTVMDQFHPWPRAALNDVAQRFLQDVSVPEDAVREMIAANMAEVHLSIDGANQRFLEQARRYNYTTPKSFLELIAFYKKLLAEKRSKVEMSIERLEKGLFTLQDTKVKVEGLQEDLKEKMVKVEEKKAAADVLIEQVTKAAGEAAIEEDAANQEAEKTNALAENAAKIQKEADEELAEAMPAMERAKDAVNCLTKPAIQELKSLGKPPPDCVEVTKAVMMMRGEKKNLDWKAAQKMMNNPGQFLEQVAAFDAENMDDETVDRIQPIISQPFFNYETMKSKSIAAAYLCNWVLNIVTYNRIYKKVKPLMDRLAEASEEKSTAEAALAIVMAKLKEVQDKVAALQAKMQEAEDEKNRVEAEANACLDMLKLAERLVNGLADENTRWSASVEGLKTSNVTLLGDCLLAAAFVSYIGAFSASFRIQLWQETWLPDIQEKQVPFTAGVDPLNVLANDADIAIWKNEGLPADRISIENASVVTSCSRWPLLIDPQLQGIKWIKSRFGDNLTVVQLTQDKWLSRVNFAIQMGGTLLLEAVPEEIDAVLDPLLSRAIVKQGKSRMFIKLGGEEVDYDAKFQLVLQTKLSNPHYRPEIAAQCTLINFIVTPDGLEEQILALIVNEEKPDLEKSKQELVRKQNEFKVTLAKLEDDLLKQLSEADPATILSNIPLIEGLENTKKTALEIQEQVKASLITEQEINASRENYRPVAAEGSMLYFLLIQLWMIQPMYQYSLDSFNTFLYKAMYKAEANDDVALRCQALLTSIRMTIFQWVTRGLFERHKLIFTALVTFRLLQRGQLAESYMPDQFQFLLRGPMRTDVEKPETLDWLPNTAWFAVQKLIELEGFDTFATNMEKDAPNRFKDWFNELAPEEVKLPLDWKKLESMPFQKLLVLRCLRPDRMTTAVAEFIRNTLPDGPAYMDCDARLSFIEILTSAFEDSTNTTPIFFILSPGADPVKEVESLGKPRGISMNTNLWAVSMGQGQDVVAMAKLETAHKEGHWVMLQNIHLMPRWLIDLEKKLENFAAEGSHATFRCFLSSDPCNYIPVGILEKSIKLTNEPPQGLRANLGRAFAFFNKEDFEDRDSKVKSILFGLCFFHAIMLERKKFGPKGWNMNYPFSIGDLRDSAKVLINYLEGQASAKVPWDDLRYIFGEIMYGGHIVDARDRLLCKTYLELYMQDELLEETELFPFCDGKGISYRSPAPASHDKYLEHIDGIPPETPLAFGLHPNAEIGFRTEQCGTLFGTLLQLMPSGSSGGEEGGSGQSPFARAEEVCQNILDAVRDKGFQVEEISKGMLDEEKGPYQNVFLQECEYLTVLIVEMQRSLFELELGFKGELTMSDQMEQLIDSLFYDKIPASWAKRAFPSTRPLASWVKNLVDRYEQMAEWTASPTEIPKCVNLSRLFNPQSFLTAIKQITSQLQSLELNKLTIVTDVTKRDAKAIDQAARDGAYVTGLYMEGARWDVSNNMIEESKPKEMFYAMPVINCKAALDNENLTKGVFVCPVYKTTGRGATYVFNAQLRTKVNPAKWILAGVGMILDTGSDL